MAEFFRIVLELPTVLFTGMLGLVVAYWALVIAGALDLDLADPGEGAEGAGLGALTDALGLAGVPVTVVGSVWTLVAWTCSVALSEWLGPFGVLGGGAVFVGASAAGVAVARLALRPFRGAFEKNEGRDRKSLVGKVARVTSLRVDGGFGRARIESGPHLFELDVRCRDANRLTAGAEVLLIDFDSDQEAFVVVPAEEALPPGWAGHDSDHSGAS